MSPLGEGVLAIEFGIEKLERYGYLTAKHCEDMITCFDTIHEHD